MKTKQKKYEKQLKFLKDNFDVNNLPPTYSVKAFKENVEYLERKIKEIKQKRAEEKKKWKSLKINK